MVSAHPSSNESQLQRLAQYRADHANVISLCDPEHLPELHRLLITKVEINTEPKALDVYEPAGAKNKFALHLSALERLWVAAGGEWIFSETKPLLVTADLYQYQACGFITREFGKRVAFRGDAVMDMLALRDDLEYEYQEKAKKGSYDGWDNSAKGPKFRAWKNDLERLDYINFCVNRDFRAKRANALKLVASDAKAVVIRKLLGVQGPFEKTVLSRPFVIVRCVVAPDYNDPECRRLLNDAAVRSALGLYGQDAAPMVALPAPAVADYTAPEATTEFYDPPKADDAPFDVTPEAPTQAESLRVDFQNTAKGERPACLALMAESKGIKLTLGYVKRVVQRDIKNPKDLTDAEEMAMYDHLAALPAAEV